MTLTWSTWPNEDWYMEFPNTPFFSEEPDSSMQKIILEQSRGLLEQYSSITNAPEAKRLMGEVIEHLTEKVSSTKWRMLKFRTYFEADWKQILKEFDAIVEILEQVIYKLNKNFSLEEDDIIKAYEKRKKEILEWKQEESQKTITPQIPNLPVLHQNRVPAKRWINFSIWSLLSLWTNWEKIWKLYHDFSLEFQESCEDFLENNITLHKNSDHAERFMREKFDEIYWKYDFPKWFWILLKKIRFSQKQTHTTHETYDEETKEFWQETRELIDVFGPSIHITLEPEVTEQFPSWITNSYKLYSWEVSEQIYLSGDKRRLTLNSDVAWKLPFVITLAQTAKFRSDVSKKYSEIVDDPVLKYLLEKIWDNSWTLWDISTLNRNIKSIGSIHENREELKKLVKYIGFENIKGYIPWSYESMVKFLNKEAKKIHPIPSRYIYRISKTLIPWERDGIETLYREETFMKDLEYYFISQRSDQFSFRLPSIPNFYQFTFFPKEKSDSNTYDTAHIDIRKNRVCIKVTKWLDIVEDDFVLGEVYRVLLLI